MNKADIKELEHILEMVNELARITPYQAMFQDGKYKVRPLLEITRIQDAIKRMLGVPLEAEDNETKLVDIGLDGANNGEADGEG